MISIPMIRLFPANYWLIVNKFTRYQDYIEDRSYFQHWVLDACLQNDKDKLKQIEKFFKELQKLEEEANYSDV